MILYKSLLLSTIVLNDNPYVYMRTQTYVTIWVATHVCILYYLGENNPLYGSYVYTLQLL